MNYNKNKNKGYYYFNVILVNQNLIIMKFYYKYKQLIEMINITKIIN